MNPAPDDARAASKTSPVPAAHFDPATGILCVGGVDGLRTTDRAVIAEASRWSTGERGEPMPLEALAGIDLGAFAREALSIGARVIGIAAQDGETRAVREAVESATAHIDALAARASESTEAASRRAAETIAATTKQASETLTGQVAHLLGGEDPELLARLRPILSQVGTDLETQLARAYATAADVRRQEDQDRHRELVDALTETRREIAVRVGSDSAAAEATASVKAVTTVKGFEYEAQVHTVCHDIAAGLGDEYRETGDTAGRLPRNKKGDGVFAVGGDVARVVVEMHDGLSKDWGSYLAEAERNRGASASIGLVRRLADNQGHLIKVVAPRRIVVVFDPAGAPEKAETEIALLRTAVLLMRTVAMTGSGSSGAAQAAVANAAISEAMRSIEELNEAQRSVNAISGHVAKVDKIITKTITTVQRELDRATVALTGGATDSGAVPEDADAETAEARPGTDPDEAAEDTDGEGDAPGESGLFVVGR